MPRESRAGSPLRDHSFLLAVPAPPPRAGPEREGAAGPGGEEQPLWRPRSCAPAGLLSPDPDSHLPLEITAYLCLPSQPSLGLPLPKLALAFLILSISEVPEELSRIRPAPGSLSPAPPMCPAASTRQKGQRAQGAPLLPLLLLLVVPGEEEAESTGRSGGGGTGLLEGQAWRGPDPQPPLQARGQYQRHSNFTEWRGRRSP